MAHAKPSTPKAHIHSKQKGAAESQQQLLPKVPVPQLKDTMKRYLEYVKVLAKNQNQFAITEDLTNKFLNNDAEKYQFLLHEIAEHESNWVNKFWLSDMYLNNRVALPVNSNPAYIFPVQYFHDTCEFLNYAACLVRGICDYKDLLDKRGLPQDMSTGIEKVPLCMEQYWRIFKSHREPSYPYDELNTHADSETGENEHILVMRKNQTYIAYTKIGGERLSYSEIRYQLDDILQKAENRLESLVTPVGLMTAAQRDRAATAFQLLLEDNVNKKSLRWILSSAFVLCLDGPTEHFSEKLNENEENFIKQGSHILHGGGIQSFGGNRWFDKSLQFVVSENGINGLNIEHSVADGIVFINLAEHALKYVEKNLRKFSHPAYSLAPKTIPKPKMLTWHISPEFKSMLNDIKPDFQS